MNTSKLVHCDRARELVTEHDGYLTIDENKLDIFSTTSKVIPDWQPSAQLPDYDSLPKLYLDIETRNLEIDPTKNRLYMIGLMNERGDIKILRDDSERVMLEDLSKILDRKSPYILATYNGMKFDLPVLAAKYKYYNLKSPFWISDRESTFTTAQLFGSPTIFHAVHIRTLSGHKIHHIDLYQQVLADDFVKRQLTSYRLKRVPEQWQLRPVGRKELSYDELLDHYDREDWQPLNDYLTDDLRDTKLIGDRLIPPLYYQQHFFTEFPFQAIATIGNASKWNSALKIVPEYALKLENEEITTDNSKRFQGALTYSIAGFFTGFVGKLDVASLYPTIMLLFGICSEKDDRAIALGILKYAKAMRIHFKTLPKDQKTNLTKQMDASLKIILNSAYGILAAKGIEFNDPTAAALVTAFGRVILKFMDNIIVESGGKVLSADTDGLFFQANDKEHSQLIFDAVSTALPNGINIEYEIQAVALYSPPSGTYEDFNKSYKFSSANGRKFLLKEFKQGVDIEKSIAQWISVRGDEKVSYDSICQFAQTFGYNTPEFEGLRKNYIIFFEDGSVKANGRYKKRDRSELQKTFQISYLKAYLISKESADKYYRDIVKAIASHDYPVENLAITRKIRSNEIKLVELGIGQKGEVATFWVGESGDQTTSERYSAEHYLEILRKMLIEIRTVL